jgi:hypothetical protein
MPPFGAGPSLRSTYLKQGQDESIPNLLVTEPSSMKGHDDPELRRTVRTSLTVYIWILIIFAVIALCGWLIGQYMR